MSQMPAAQSSHLYQLLKMLFQPFIADRLVQTLRKLVETVKQRFLAETKVNGATAEVQFNNKNRYHAAGSFERRRQCGRPLETNHLPFYYQTNNHTHTHAHLPVLLFEKHLSITFPNPAILNVGPCKLQAKQANISLLLASSQGL